MKVLVETNKEKIDALVTNFKETFSEYKKEIKESLNRLEHKQDKHNNLIERMAICEQSTKSSHHRQDELTERVNIIERKIS